MRCYLLFLTARLFCAPRRMRRLRGSVLRASAFLCALIVAAPCMLAAQTNAGKQDAKQAVADMDAAFAGRQPAGGAANAGGGARSAAAGVSRSNAPAPVITADKNGRPNWVDRPDAAYNAAFYLARTGSGRSRVHAEAAAFAALTGYFGQTVQSQLSTVETYKEQARGGAIDVSSNQSLDNAIQVSSNVDQLIGAEIGAVWQDGKDKAYYAVAVMDKAKCAALYASLIDANVALIEKLTALKAAERASLDGLIRFRRAAYIADANGVFATILYMLDGPNRRGDLASGDDFRLEAKNITKTIPVYVVVQNDSAGRIKAAFAQTFSAAGFQTGGSASRYALKVSFKLSPAEFPGQPNKYSRYEITADLTDSAGNTTLTTFSLNGREGHVSQAEADQRAVRSTESAVKTTFAAELDAYLSGGISDASL